MGKNNMKKSFATNDGYRNLAARLGMEGKNLLASSTYSTGGTSITRDRSLLEAMYRSSWLVGKAIDSLADDMTKGGVDIKAPLPADKIDEMYRYMADVKLWQNLADAIRWGDLYGGAIAVILIDGDNISTPLNIDAIAKGSFKGLRVLDRWQVTPSEELIEGPSPMEGYPVYYIVNDSSGGKPQAIHHTRALRFTGLELPYYQRLTEMHWGASIVERWYDRLVAFDSATHGSANLMLKAYLRVFKIENFRDILAGGGASESALIKAMEYTRMFESNEGITLMDKADEFQTFSWSFGGVSDALLSFGEQIAGATGIPLVRLFGQSPKGLSATGESDIRTYYDAITAKQNNDLRPVLDSIFPVLAASLWGVDLPVTWRYDFKPLWQMDSRQMNEIACTAARSITDLYVAGIISKEDALNELRSISRDTGRFTSISG